MTKILIMDSYQNIQKKNMENMRNNFLFSWLFGNDDSGESEENLQLRGQLLGIDIDFDRVVVVFGVIEKNCMRSPKMQKMNRDYTIRLFVRLRDA